MQPNNIQGRMTVPKLYSAEPALAVSGKDDYRDNHSSIEKTLVVRSHHQ
jgi:hypothetical protein